MNMKKRIGVGYVQNFVAWFGLGFESEMEQFWSTVCHFFRQRSGDLLFTNHHNWAEDKICHKYV